MGLRKWLPVRSRDRVALFVDGPNVFRSEFDVDMADLRETAATEGTIVLARVYVDEHASPGLIRAAEAHGFEVVVTSGDVDVKLAVDATAVVGEDSMDVLVLASRDTDFKPLLEHAALGGIRTVAVAPGRHGRSEALVAVADDAVVLDRTP